MKTMKDESNLSYIIHSSTGKGSIGAPGSSQRPISALNMRSERGLKTKQSNMKYDFPNLMKGKNNNTEYSLAMSSKGLVPSTTREKEKLYEETIQLKTNINSLKKEMSSLKHEILRKDQEINKKDKVLEDIVVESQNNLYGGFSSPDTMNKAKEANLVFKMKKQFKDLKREFNDKCEEVENLKKLVKVTKYNEFTIEIKTLTEELNKLRSLYKHSLQQNEMMEGNLKEFQNLQENFSKQHFIIISLQENLTKTNEEFNTRNEEINQLNGVIEEKVNLLKKTKKELQLSQMLSEKLTKEKKENNEVTMLRNRYESQIADLTKEMNRFRDMADRKDRQVRELESSMKKIKSDKLGSGSGSGSGSGYNKSNAFNYNDIKYIQENPEDKYDNITLLLKSKLQEKVQDNDILKKRNKLLEKKIEFVEEQIGVKIKDDIINLDDESNSSLTDHNNNNIINNNNLTRNTQNKNNQIDNTNSNQNVDYNNNNRHQHQHQHKQEEEEEEENDHNLESEYFDDDQLTEFTYILIKNFEAKKLSRKEAERIIKDIMDTNHSSDSTTLSKDLVNKLSNKLFKVLKIKNDEELKKMGRFINTILSNSNNNPTAFAEKFLSLFDNVKVYSEDELLHLSKKLKKHILQFSAFLLNSLKMVDLNNTGYVTFLTFRRILESVNLRLKDKYIEFLIYVMKSNEDFETSIYNLKYESMFRLINNAPDDSKLESSEELDEDYLNTNENENENDESEIVITTDQFNEKINSFLKSLSDYLKLNKITLRELFKGEIYKVREVENGDEFKNVKDEAIELKTFLNEIKRIGVELGSLDVYCIYTKLKIIDDYEAISITVMEQELRLFDEMGSNSPIKSNISNYELDDKNNNMRKNSDNNLINLHQVNEDDEDYSKCSFENNNNQ